MSAVERSRLEAALVRVWRGDQPVGAGFLAGPQHIVTAAHVVAAAIGVPARGALPADLVASADPVEVDFPLLSAGRRVSADVAAWQPVAEDRSGDVAGLRPTEPLPAGARPLPLTRHGGLSDDQLIMVGFPRRLEHGSWVYGRAGGPVSTGWVEILRFPDQEGELAPGFSGSPVWHSGLDAAVGMVVNRITGAPPKIGYMLPVPALLAAWPDLEHVIEKEVPFRALRPFTERDAKLFFGREQQADELARRAWDTLVLCVVGPSGVGKSSLLRAGVLPRLRQRPGLASVVLRPSDASTPLRALALAFDRIADPYGDAAARATRLQARADRLGRPGGVSDEVGAVIVGAHADRLVIVVDQFEEIFSHEEPAQAEFIAALRAVARPGSRVRIVLGLQDTFLNACLRSAVVTELAAGWVLATVGELASDQLRQVLEEPLKQVPTVRYQPGLVDRLVEEVRGAAAALPLLQVTLAGLWEAKEDGLLTRESLDRLGGVRGALARYAEDIWSTLDADSQQAAERLLAQLTHPLPDEELSVRRNALASELDEAQWTVAQRLAATRLLVLRSDPEPGVELAHESMLSQWDRLRELTARFRGFRIWQESLRQRMARWAADGQRRRRLLSGADLRDANRWARSNGPDLGSGERHFLQLSNQYRRVRSAGAAVVAAVLAIAAFAGVTAYRSAAEQRAELAARDLASTANQLFEYDSYGAVQLALRAYRTDPTVPLHAAGHDPLRLHQGIDWLVPDHRGARRPSGPAATTAADVPQARESTYRLSQQVSADGRLLVAKDPAGRPVLWHLDRRGRDPAFDALSDPLTVTAGLTISRSGRFVAVILTLFPRVPDDLDDAVRGPVDDEGLPVPDGQPTCPVESLAEIAVCLVVYDTIERRVHLAVPVGGLFSPYQSARLSIDPADQLLAVTVPGSTNALSPDGVMNTVELWDLRTGARRARLSLPWRSWVSEMWLGPGGQQAVTYEIIPRADHLVPDRLSVAIVDLSGAEPERVELSGGVEAMTMSLDGSTLAVLAGGSGTPAVTVWDTASGAVRARLELTQEEGSGVPALDATGSLLVIPWLADDLTSYGQSPITDVRDVPERRGRQLSIWRLPGPDGPAGAVPVGPQPFDTPWRAMVPLGGGLSAPVAMLSSSSIGLILPGAGPEPVARVAATAAAGDLSTGEAIDRMCRLLADPETDEAVREFVPPDAYEGEVCPS